MNFKNKNTVFILLVIFSLIFGGSYYKYSCEKNAQRFLNQGNKFFGEYNFSDAYYNYKQIKKFSNLYEISLLKQYQCAINLSDKKTAHAKIKEIVKISKNKHIRPWAMYNETILNNELNSTNNNELSKKYNRIIKEYPESDFSVASAFKLAELLKENDIQKAKKHYLDYLSYAPAGKFSQKALNSLESMQLELTKEDNEIIAESYYQNENYSKALDYYQKTSFNQNWYNISKCYRNKKDYIAEKQIIQKGLNLKINKVEEKDIDDAIDRIIALSNGSKLSILQELYNLYKSQYVFPAITYKLAETSPTLRSIKLYECIVNDYPESIFASNSLWEIFWYNYGLGRYQACEKLAKRHALEYENTQDAPRIMYWHGKALLKERKNSQARDIFYKTINDYPQSYYAFLSARQLKMSRAKKMIIKRPIKGYNLDILNKQIFNSDETLLILANQNDWEMIDNFKINDEYIKSWITYKKGNYPSAINIAKKEFLEQQETDITNNKSTKQKTIFQNQLLKLQYPIMFEEEINTHAHTYKQSPYLFLSLVREESHFNKNAQSSVGAIGLSQIMPQTANFIENKAVSKETLQNPNENIRIGLKYFTYLNEKFNNNEYLAILSYNAGPGNVNKWLNNTSINKNEIDSFVENIPFIETKNYIKKILSSYWIYLNIYSNKNK